MYSGVFFIMIVLGFGFFKNIYAPLCLNWRRQVEEVSLALQIESGVVSNGP